MEINTEVIDKYFQRLLEKRKWIIATVDKNPIQGVDISKLTIKQKIYLGGIQKLKIEADNEILSLYNFVATIIPEFIPSEELKTIKEEIDSTHVELLEFEGEEVVLSKNIESLIKA